LVTDTTTRKRYTDHSKAKMLKLKFQEIYFYKVYVSPTCCTILSKGKDLEEKIHKLWLRDKSKHVSLKD
jgi:hypothetical protein